MGRKLQIKRGLQADIPILSEGEFGLTTDQKKLYIGAPGGNVRLATETDIAAVNNSLSGVVDRGYVVSKPRYDITDANLLRTNGKYVLRGDTTINLPDRSNFYNVDVADNGDSTYTVQFASCLVNTDNRRFMRHGTGNVWTPWREIATMDKVPQTESGVFTPTLETGDGGKVSQYSTQSGTYYKIGNLVRIYINIGIANMGSLGAGQNRIKGLPFVIKKAEAVSGGIWYANVYLPTGTSQAIVSAVDGGANLSIDGCGNDKYTPLEVSNFKINSIFSIDMTVVI